MSFEEEFDMIIRQKVQDHNVPFDQNNWEKAQQMIDAGRKPLAVKSTLTASKIAFSILGFIAIVSTSVYFYDNLNQSTSKNTANQKLNSNQAETAVVANPLAENQTKVTGENKLTAEVLTAESAAIQTNQKTNATEKMQLHLSEKVSASDATVKNTKQVNLPPQASSNQPLSADITVSKAMVNVENKEMTSENTIEKSDLDQSTNMNTNATLESVQQTQTQSDNQLMQPSATVASSLTKNNKSSGLTTDASKLADNMPVASVTPMLPYTLSQNNNVDTVLKAGMDEKLIIKANTFSSNAITKHKFLNIGIGANYSSGWLEKNGRDANGFNYFAHLNYGFYVSRKFSMGAGLDFYNLQNIHQAFYTTDKTEYGFSSVQTFTSVTSNNLKYIGIPLKLYVDLNPSNIISLGLLPSFLIGAQNTVEVFQQLDGQKITLQKTNNQLLYNGIAQKNIQLNLGYKLKVTGRVWLQTEVSYGLSDVFENNNSNKFSQKTMGIRLGVQYHIFDK